MASDLSAPVQLVEEVWREQDTTPERVAAGLRELLRQGQEAADDHVRARVLNLVAVVDADWRGEIENRLERVGRYHPSRTIVCAVRPGQRTLDAWATLSESTVTTPGGRRLWREQVELTLGEGHLRGLRSTVDPILVTDLTTVVWAPHGHTVAVDALAGMAEVVLIDSIDEPDVRAAVARAEELAEKAYVVDLAWLRSTPWRERLAATFDPPAWRPALNDISAVTVRHHPASVPAALLFAGWLGARLRWRLEAMIQAAGVMHGRCRAQRHEVVLRLEPDNTMPVPGLAGLSLETGTRGGLELNRGPGGLTAVRRARDGSEQRWTVMGASRGEAGILGEGVRQALLRDPAYREALAASRMLLG